MKTTYLQIDKPYTLKMFCGPVKVVYDGIRNTPSGLLWAFKAAESITTFGAIIPKDSTFCLPYDATGVEIY